jgi:hypothetical protein
VVQTIEPGSECSLLRSGLHAKPVVRKDLGASLLLWEIRGQDHRDLCKTWSSRRHWLTAASDYTALAISQQRVGLTGSSLRSVPLDLSRSPRRSGEEDQIADRTVVDWQLPRSVHLLPPPHTTGSVSGAVGGQHGVRLTLGKE